MTARRRAGAYTRCSTAEQIQGHSLDDQRQRCLAWAEDLGAEVEVYEDAGFSGAKERRPALDRLVADIQAGRLDVIVATKQDRLFRTTLGFLRFVEQLDQAGVELVLVDQPEIRFQTRGERTLATIFAAMAQNERDLIAERTRMGQDAKARAGGWPGGAPPFGYRLEGRGRDGRIVVDEREQQVLLTAISLVLDDGVRVSECAKRLNALGLNPRGFPPGHPRHRADPRWNPSSLRLILKRRSMLGTTEFRGTSKTGKRGHHTTGLYGPAIELPLPPIPGLTAERVHALWQRLDEQGTAPYAASAHYPLSGLLVGTCGHHYSGVRNKERDHRNYKCSGRATDRTGVPRCSDHLLRAEGVESVVWAAVSDLLCDSARLQHMAEDYVGLRLTQVGVEEDEVRQLDSKIASRSTLISQTMASLMATGADPSAVAAAFNEAQGELDALKRHRAELEGWRADSAAEARRMDEIVRLAEVAAGRMGQMTLEQQATVLRLLDVRVEIMAWDGAKPRPKLRITGTVLTERLLNMPRHDDIGPTTPTVSRTSASR